MYKILLYSLIFWLPSFVCAQELNCRISVNHQQVMGTSTELFDALRKDVYEFMNNQRWTNHVYDLDERIESAISINISTVVGSEQFVATVQVQSSRPVYGSNYTTTLLNHQETKNEFIFNYVEGQALEYNEQAYTSELVAVLSYYAYVIIGMDYDTFSSEGGYEYFNKARTIAANARTAGAGRPGWSSYESLTNRYHLIENLTSDKLKPLRKCMYKMHREGLDVMFEQPEVGRTAVAEALKLMRNAYRAESLSMLFPMFMTTKSDEIIKIFGPAQGTEKQEVIAIMKETDPGNAAKYDKI